MPTTPGAMILARIDEILATRRFSSSREWCRQAGVSESYITTLRARLSTGEVTGASGVALQRLAAAAGVSVDWLMGGPDGGTTVPIPPARPRAMTSPTPDEVLNEFDDWPEAMDPESAQNVVHQLRTEMNASWEIVPPRFWLGRLRHLVAEAMEAASRVRPRHTPAVEGGKK